MTDKVPGHRPRVLVLTPRFPYPVVGGDRLRIYQMCKALAAQADLTLLSLCESVEEMQMPMPDDGVFSSIERVWLPRWRSRLNTLMALPTRTPLQVAYYRSGAFARKVASALPRHDLVLAHLIRTAEYVRHAPCPRVLEMTDAISLNYQRVSCISAAHFDFRTWVYRVEANRLLAYERQVMLEFDRTLLVSEVDRAFLLDGRDDQNVLVCSNGVDLSSLPFEDRTEAEPVVVFIGNMTTVQNMDACRYFASEVMPLLRQRGDFRFRIVGRMDAGVISNLSAYPGVELCPNVHSVAEATRFAYAGVAPMRLGAGVQNKVLEYMALGLASVVSTVGHEGLEAVPGRDLLIADSPEQYVEALCRLWKDRSMRRDVACAAWQYVEERHAWRARLAPLMCALSELTGGAR